jgi:hypothetical protein
LENKNYKENFRKNTFGGQKGGKKPLEFKNGIWGPKSVWRKKNYTFEGQKGKTKPLEPKNGI